MFAVYSGFVAPVYFAWQYTVRDDVETRVFEVRYPRRTRAVYRRHDVRNGFIEFDTGEIEARFERDYPGHQH